ncbi:Piso0_005272 [Millerozyma farinosa CBS 7064]|uniref:phosphatidylinositol-3,4,5-trisphosphate 3-phosphatase n=1 Tax=Pichia sorbitophila (strain ATCC MYA-4447 / BCRC 22081 / CBS 7064 / NBRC 10061 / NRRL Y-12695) TaxID=559304 RepID=G8Y1Q9_PICSO|nr:Piso0_005272 [Millerozyma farinosa CBS 7064]
MKNLIRSIVSAPKQVYYDNNLDIQFDLSYVTDQVIVSAGPVRNTFKEIYRYPVKDLVKILEFNHRDQWYIWNFRSEGLGYSENDVFHKISSFLFPDHQPPPLRLIYKCVLEIDQFLSKDKKNVAVLHCKAGKGRSGTMCCAYLMYHCYNQHGCLKTEEIMDLYTRKRMRSYSGNGISIQSQRRYLRYWERLLTMPEEMQKYEIDDTSPLPYDLEKSCITMIKIHNPSSYYNDVSKIFDLDIELEKYSQSDMKQERVDITSVYQFSPLDISCKKKNTIILIPEREIILNKIKDVKISIKSFCYCWFDMLMETIMSNREEVFHKSDTDANEFIRGHFTVPWEDLDGFRGSTQKGMKLFSDLEICWRLYY